MRKLAAYDREGRITVRNCTVCGRDCETMTFRTRWRKRPANACLDLARAAAELLTAHVRSCEEWRQRAEAATHHLWRLLWHTPTKNVDDALASAAVRLIQEHVRDDDIAGTCAALETHRPDIGEAVRIIGGDRATKLRNPHAPPAPSPTVWWVRCDMHGTWCAAGLRKIESTRSFIRHLAAREIVGLRLIAARSRSCEEFRARRARIPSIPRGMIGHDMGFVPAGRGRWVRNDENGAIKLFYGAAVWSTLAPALQPWETVAMAGLESANGQT